MHTMVLSSTARRRLAQPYSSSKGVDPALRPHSERIKAMLKYFGLRPSLIRLKIIDALLHADEEGAPMGAHGVHRQLQEQGATASFLSVREVLKRLSGEGLIKRNDDKTYVLTDETRGRLRDEASGLDAAP